MNLESNETVRAVEGLDSSPPCELADRVAYLSSQARGLSDLAGQILATLKHPRNQQALRNGKSGAAEDLAHLVETWERRYEGLVELTKDNPGPPRG